MVSRPPFASRALPFMLLVGAGSWGLSQFLKLPVQVKDENRRRKKEGRAKFSLEQENEKLTAALAPKAAEYENVRVPGPRPTWRRPAD
ncbi:hypothetical protein AB1Y20_022177 [Prymnesium parvum]|uniref:Cytochrome c oxidase assembly protein COX16, mitochondrial n=1 Tax=Prymnesium parvum TaxID=97485 RepID=A0AB34JGK9_PRYPA|mmetsp:Transcript_2099/g.5265  ORF Transcript_2099/g.5265 Transcript_2099/m.5265 type:complete len:88 (-) Transcript_2099:281-544(-)